MAVLLGGISGTGDSMFYRLTKNTVEYAVSLKKISDKKNVLKTFLANIDDYVGSAMDKRITKDNFKYALTLKSPTAINKALKVSLNALK
jgi:hypothetical protein